MSSHIYLYLFGEKVSADNVTNVVHVCNLFHLSIQDMYRMAGDVVPDNEVKPTENTDKVCLFFKLLAHTPIDQAEIKDKFKQLSKRIEVDLVLLFDVLRPKLVVFDMDSTLIKAEVIDELAREAGVYEEVSRLTNAAMQGEISFDKSFQHRVSSLQGLNISALKAVWHRLELMDGAALLIKNLRSMGIKTAIISSGFTYFASGLKKMLGFDYIFANELRIREDVLTGAINNIVIDAEGKANLVTALAEQEKITMSEIIAVGDGANDIKMLSTAGFGIAIHAKPALAEVADGVISHYGLDAILHLLGIHERDFIELDLNKIVFE